MTVTSNIFPNLPVWVANQSYPSTQGVARASTGTYFNASGNFTVAAINELRVDHDRATPFASRGNLLESTSTNYIRNVTGASAVAGSPGTDPNDWGFTSSGGGLTRTIAVGTEQGIPYVEYTYAGTTTAATQIFTNIVGAGSVNTAIAPAGVTLLGTTWTASIYMRVTVNTGLTNIGWGFNEWNYNAAPTPAVTTFLVVHPSTVLPTNAALATQRFTLTSALTGNGVAQGTGPVNFLTLGPTFNVVAGTVNFTVRIGLPQMEMTAAASSAIIQTGAVPAFPNGNPRAADLALIPRRVQNSANAYQLITAGVSAASGGPTTTASSITDNTCVWQYLGHVDYQTVQAWSNSVPTSLTDNYVGQIWNTGPITTTVGGAFVDNSATTYTMNGHTLTLTVAAGDSFCDTAANQTTPLAFNADIGASFLCPSTGVSTVDFIKLLNDSAILSRIQIKDPNSGSGSTPISIGTNCLVDSCLIDGYTQGSGANLVQVQGGLTRNTIIIDRNSGVIGAIGLYNWNNKVGKVVNCTLMLVTANTSAKGFGSDASTAAGTYVRNCIFLNYTGTLGTQGGPIDNTSVSLTVDHCLFSNASNTCITAAGATDSGGNLFGRTAVNQFVSNTVDFRLKAGADAVNVGVTDTVDIPTAKDIVGTSRTQGGAWDIGAWELASGTLWQGVVAISGGVVSTAAAGHTAQGAASLSVLGNAIAAVDLPFLQINDATPATSPLTASNVQAAQVTFTWLASTQTGNTVASAVIRTGQVLASGTTAVVAAGQVVAAGPTTIAIAGAATTAVAAIEIAQAQITIAGTGFANSLAVATHPGTAVLNGIGNGAADTIATYQGVATVAGVGVAAIASTLRVAQGVAAIAGAGVASAAATVIDRQSVIAIVGTGVAVANGTHAPQGVAAIVGTGIVIAVGTPIDRQTLILSSGVGSAVADTIHTPLAASSILPAGSVAVTPVLLAAAAVSVSGASAATVLALEIASVQVAVTHTGLGFTNATHTPLGTILLAGSGSAVSDSIQLFAGPNLVQAFADLVGSANVVPSVYLLEFVAPQIVGVGSTVLREKVLAQTTSALAGTATTLAIAAHTPVGASPVSGAAVIGATAGQIFSRNPAVVNGAANVAVTGAVLATATSQPITATASVTAVAQVTGAQPTAINGSVSVAVSTSVRVAAAINLAGSAAVAADSSHTPAGDAVIAGIATVASAVTASEAGFVNIAAAAAFAVAAQHTPDAIAAIAANTTVATTETVVPAVHVTNDGTAATIVDDTLVTAINAGLSEIDGLGIAAVDTQQGSVVSSLMVGIGTITVNSRVEPIYSSDIALQGIGSAFLSVNIVTATHAEGAAAWRTVSVGSITTTQPTQV